MIWPDTSPTATYDRPAIVIRVATEATTSNADTTTGMIRVPCRVTHRAPEPPPEPVSIHDAGNVPEPESDRDLWERPRPAIPVNADWRSRAPRGAQDRRRGVVRLRERRRWA